MAVTQRRGQRTGTDAADKKSKEVAPVSPAKLSLQDQLDRAEEAVLKSRDTTAQLHVWWRQHLFRLSMLVLLLSLHQTQVPSTECIKNIKIANEGESSYSGFDAFYYILNDSVVEIMGLIMMTTLTYFLYDETKPAKFDEPMYMISTMLVPMQVATYFQQPQIGCAGLVPDAEPVDRAFPISMIYHTIVTLSCFFMNYQMTARNKAIKSVVTMRKNLAEAERKEAESKKKAGKKK